MTPPTGVGCAAANIAWNRASREKVDIYCRTGPFSCIHTATIGVETRAVGQCICCINLASGVSRLTGSIDVAIGRSHSASVEAVVGDGAARTSMECHVIGCLRVDAFDDIDFPIRRPTGTNSPATCMSVILEIYGRRMCLQRRPSATDPARHVSNVRDDETMIVRLLARNTDTSSA